MLYLIGLGLELESIGKEALELCKQADKVYLEGYTVDFPYDISKIEETIGKNIEILKREKVESDEIVKEGKEEDIVLLVYGSPLMATTHISLILDSIENKVEYRIIHNGSIYDAIANTGLQPYKFGKTASLPDWEKKGESKSFVDIIENNMKIKAHTLLLIDIGLDLDKALEELKKASDNKIKRVIIGSKLGTKQERIYYDSVDKLKELSIEKPYCFIIPSNLHFREKEALEEISERIGRES